jgi:hypothetical protein
LVTDPVEAVEAAADGDADEDVEDVVPDVDPVDDEEVDLCVGEAAVCVVVLLSEWCTV